MGAVFRNRHAVVLLAGLLLPAAACDDAPAVLLGQVDISPALANADAGSSRDDRGESHGEHDDDEDAEDTGYELTREEPAADPATASVTDAGVADPTPEPEMDAGPGMEPTPTDAGRSDGTEAQPQHASDASTEQTEEPMQDAGRSTSEPRPPEDDRDGDRGGEHGSD